MADEKKDKGAGDLIKILLEESLERQRNAMMDSFAQILQRLPRSDTSASNSYSRNTTPFKRVYFSAHEFSSREKIVFALLKAAPHIKDWWETYCEQKDEITGSLFLAVPTWDSFRDAIKEQYYPIKSYEDKYIKWTMLRYIQEEMESMNISSLGTTYRYVVKIEQKFKQKKRDFGSANLKTKGQSQGGVTQDNPSKQQEKNNTTKSKKHIGQWCEFHKSPTHNTSECQTKQSLVAELKASESDACSDPEPEPDKGNGKGKQIIDADPSATISTTKIQKNEPENPEEGEHLFHSQMWVKGSPLQFIVDSGSQKNLVSAEIVKRLGLLTTPHPQPYSIGWLHEGRDLKVH
eukprot:PITA_27416